MSQTMFGKIWSQHVVVDKGADFATESMPTMVPPPVRYSTMTGWFQSSLSFCE